MNKHIRELTLKYKNVVLTDVLFCQSFSTNHGLHLNMKGKKHPSHLVELIIDNIGLAARC